MLNYTIATHYLQQRDALSILSKKDLSILAIMPKGIFVCAAAVATACAASPLADRRKAQAKNPRADLKYFVAERLRKAGELEEAVSQALVCVVWKRPGTERLAGPRRPSHER